MKTGYGCLDITWKSWRRWLYSHEVHAFFYQL